MSVVALLGRRGLEKWVMYYYYTSVADNERFGERNVAVNKCCENGQQTIYRVLVIVAVNNQFAEF